MSTPIVAIVTVIGVASHTETPFRDHGMAHRYAEVHRKAGFDVVLTTDADRLEPYANAADAPNSKPTGGAA